MPAAINPFEEVLDTDRFPIFDSANIYIPLPKIFGFQITKLMVLELIAFGLIAFFYIRLARRVRDGTPAKGWFDNALESLLTFVRDQVARPALGDHDADRFMPLLWTMFLFILFCNLLGMFPYLGSPTASLAVTGALALVAFGVIHGTPISRVGFGHYLKSFVPHIHLGDSLGMKLFGAGITVLMIVIELFSAFVRGVVLAIRLFANMLAGHTALAVLLSFIALVGQANSTAGAALFWPISIGSVAMAVALSLLELFVAFLQAFIFTFLTSLFLSMALHPEH
jgi:F-type H+-transporting ATPase subunit a